MKKNNYSTHYTKVSKNTKYNRVKSPSITKSIQSNKPPNESKNEIPIIDLLKCPICKKICLMNIDRDELLFSFECNNNHTIKLQKSNTYSEQNISNISDLDISKSNLNNLNKDNNTSNISGSYNSKKNNPPPKIYITEKDFYCTKHPSSKYVSYCYECKENICKQCIEHVNHNKIELNTLKPKDDEVILYKNDVKKKEEELNNLVDAMMKWQKEFELGLSTIIKIMQNISNLRQFIINNYDSKQSNQNYNYIKNFHNMKEVNFIFPELQEFLKEPNWKQKGHILIEIIVNIQNKIIKNKEKLEEIKLKKEAEKLKENLAKQEKKLKSKKKNLNKEENEDMGSVDTTNSSKKKNFKTTFNSDNKNNIFFFPSMNSRQAANNRNTKKKIIEKRNKNSRNDVQTRTIEQNKELEKDLNNKNEDNNKKDENDDKNENINLSPKMIKEVETTNKNTEIFETFNNNNIKDNKDESINVNNINSINYNKDDNNNIEEEEKNNDTQFNDIQNISDNNIKTFQNEQNEKNEQNEQNEMNQQNEINQQNENNSNNTHGFNVENNNIDENDFNNNNPETINSNNNNNYNNNKIDNLSINDINNINNSNNDYQSNYIEEKEKDINMDNIMGQIKEVEVKNEELNIEALKNKKNSNQKNLFHSINLKYELINTDMIRSIEFINTDHILICTLENITVYKMNSNYELIKEYDIKEFNYRINYATQLSNGDLIICSLSYINIIRLSKDESSSYDLVQKLNGKNDSYNINKVIEIKEKNYLISCDKNNLIIFAKNGETNLYEENNFINIDSEVKCLEAIDENIFVTLEPEKECVIFYDIENNNNIFVISNIKSAFGRYVISYLKQYNCIFVTGRQGIYLISTEKYELITFFKVNEWISSISYDYYNDYLICGTWKKNPFNEQKKYNLIIYEIAEENLENKTLDSMNIREVDRKDNVHSHDIVVIKPTKEGFILTGSNDRTVKVWK